MGLLNFDLRARVFVSHSRANMQLRRETARRPDFDVNLSVFCALRLPDSYSGNLPTRIGARVSPSAHLDFFA